MTRPSQISQTMLGLSDQGVFRKRLLCPIGVCVFFFASANASIAFCQEPTDTEAEIDVKKNHTVQWVTSIEKGKELGRMRNAPIVAVISADWCEPCQLLKKEIKDPVLQKELQRWVAVMLDADNQSDEADQLAVSSLPSLRILSTDGRMLHSSDGFLSADDFSQWLKRRYQSSKQESTSRAGEVGSKLQTSNVVNILKDFRSRNSIVRESAITRLSAVPELAAAHVIANFQNGSLADQLASLELLSVWNAPVDGLDPWIPESITDDRIQKLEQWLISQPVSLSQDEQELSPVEILEVRRLLDQISTADAVAATALREQLARIGTRALPLVHEALANGTDATRKERVLAARYRISSSLEFNQNWPGGIERLASSDYEIRVNATMEFAQRATPNEELLLVELFRDPLPLVREISLNALSRLRGDSANNVLLKLLNDPDANVRAAVLKSLADNPSPKLVDKVAEYTQQETDADLIVHAIRLLREVDNAASVNAMTELFVHPSWRVRSEAADGVVRVLESDEFDVGTSKNRLAQRFMSLLQDEDDYVIAQAIKGIQILEHEKALGRLIELAVEKEHLAPNIMPILTDSYFDGDQATKGLRRIFQSGTPQLRAASVAALVQSKGEDALEQIESALGDSESIVRIAVLDSIFQKAATDKKSFQQTDSPLTTDVSPTQELSEEDVGVLAWRNSKENWIATNRWRFLHCLESENQEEVLAASRVLAILGNSESLKLLKTSRLGNQSFSELFSLFLLLTWEEKKELFISLVETATSNDDIASMSWAFSKSSDIRAMPLLWEILGRDNVDASLAGRLFDCLSHSAKPDRWSFARLRESENEPSQIVKDARGFIDNGTRWQKIVALGIIGNNDQSEGQTIARSLFDASQTSKQLKIEAFKAILYWSEPDVAKQFATQILLDTMQMDRIRELSLRFLAFGDDEIRYLVNEILLVSDRFYDSKRAWIVPMQPMGVLPENIEHFINKDERTRIAALHLLVLLGQREHLETITQFWRPGTDDELLRRLVYRSIATANASEYVPLLAQIYEDIQHGWDSSEVHEFYWTIRIMSGTEVLNLRQTIRRRSERMIVR